MLVRSLKGYPQPSARSSNASSASLYYLQGYLTAQGTGTYAYPIYLSPGQILQVQLQAPTSVNYDLYLYKFNMSTGNLIATPVDTSTFTNDSTSLVKSVGSVNLGTSDEAYALYVHATTGFSSTNPFTLYYAIGDEYDDFESDKLMPSAFRTIDILYIHGRARYNIGIDITCLTVGKEDKLRQSITMKDQREQTAALLVRISRDDGEEGESNSKRLDPAHGNGANQPY